jgi:hypothetical protein
MFYMSIFVEGSSTGIANSHYFNISSPGTSPKQSSTSLVTSSSSTATSISNATSISSSISASAPAATEKSYAPLNTATTTPSATAFPSSPSESEGLGAKAKAGIGIGASVAVLVGLIIGWLISGRRWKRRDVTGGNAPPQYTQSASAQRYPDHSFDLSNEGESRRESMSKGNHDLETTQPIQLHEMSAMRY